MVLIHLHVHGVCVCVCVCVCFEQLRVSGLLKYLQKVFYIIEIYMYISIGVFSAIESLVKGTDIIHVL